MFPQPYVANASSMFDLKTLSSTIWGMPEAPPLAFIPPNRLRHTFQPDPKRQNEQLFVPCKLHPSDQTSSISPQPSSILGRKGMRDVAHSGIRLFAAQGEPEIPPFSDEKCLNYLKDLRETPTVERFQKLDAIPTKMRRRLFEGGDEMNNLVHRLIVDFDWQHFTLDQGGIAGLYPYALISRLPYLCSLSDEEWESLTTGYETLTKAGFNILALHENEETVEEECNRVMLLVRGSDVVISIRGTQVDSDWDINLDFFSSSGEEVGLPGNYHTGYLKVFNKLWAHVGPELELLREASANKQLNIGVVGHSMGGVLSMMFAQKLWDVPHMHVRKVVNLGGVRGFDGEACKAYEERGLSDCTTRVINFIDVVPLGWPNMSHPTADRIFLTINGKYWVNPDPMAVVKNQWKHFTAGESHGYDGVKRVTDDHDLACYIKILNVHSHDDSYPVHSETENPPKKPPEKPGKKPIASQADEADT